MPTRPLASRLAEDLARVRHRGLDGIDDDEPPDRVPVVARDLTELAGTYCQAKCINLADRKDQIRQLLKDSFAAYSERGDQAQADSKDLDRLFFDHSGTHRPVKVVEALRIERHWKMEDFEPYWRKLRRPFVAFLITFVAQESHQAANARPTIATTEHSLQRAMAGMRSVSRNPVAVSIAGLIAGILVSLLVIDLVSGGQLAKILTHAPDHTTYSMQATPEGSITVPPKYLIVALGLVAGVPIQPNRIVEVRCKTYGPNDGAYSGNWYLLTSPPWNGRYLAPEVAPEVLRAGQTVPALYSPATTIPDC